MGNDWKVRNWVEKAVYDLDTAKVMHEARRYLYVGFMCQQALEKLLKACYISEKGSEPPYTHNLRFLAESVSIPFTPEDVQLFDHIVAYYIAGRYPSY